MSVLTTLVPTTAAIPATTMTAAAADAVTTIVVAETTTVTVSPIGTVTAIVIMTEDMTTGDIKGAVACVKAGALVPFQSCC